MTYKWSSWVNRVLLDLADRYDVVMGVESDWRDRRGTLGHGKTDVGLRIAYHFVHRLNEIARVLGYKDLTFDFDIARDMVVVDDLVHFRALVRAPGFGRIKVYDEAEWFFGKRYHAFRDVRALDPLFDSNRKQGGIHVMVLPRVYDMIDKISRERMQWLWRKRGRTSMTLHVRNGVVDEKRNVWGREVATFTDLPPVPAPLWRQYEALYDAHMETCPEEERCVSAIRDRWGDRRDKDA